MTDFVTDLAIEASSNRQVASKNVVELGYDNLTYTIIVN